MIIYKDYIIFNILGKEIEVISNETDHGLITVINFDDHFYYLGNEPASLDAIVFAWQDYYKVNLSDQDLKTIMESN